MNFLVFLYIFLQNNNNLWDLAQWVESETWTYLLSISNENCNEKSIIVISIIIVITVKKRSRLIHDYYQNIQTITWIIHLIFKHLKPIYRVINKISVILWNFPSLCCYSMQTVFPNSVPFRNLIWIFIEKILL